MQVLMQVGMKKKEIKEFGEEEGDEEKKVGEEIEDDEDAVFIFQKNDNDEGGVNGGSASNVEDKDTKNDDNSGKNTADIIGKNSDVSDIIFYNCLF